MRDMPILLLTRPLAQSHAFAEHVQKDSPSLDVICAPLMRIKLFDLPCDAASARGLIFTSVNGVNAWQHANLPTMHTAFCVGDATGVAAKQLGFQVVAAKGTAESLIETITAHKAQGPLLHIHGVHTRGDIAAVLTKAGIETNGLAAYDQELLPLSPDAQQAVAGNSPVILPLFSPRSAAHAATCIPPDAVVYPVCISQNVANCLPMRWKMHGVTAQTTTAKAMIQAIGSQLERINAG